MEKFEVFKNLLKSELVVATGCTEPIALSYAANVLKENLGYIPTKVEAYICGNIIKNAKSVTVPSTNGLKGIIPALASGLVVKNDNKQLEILENLKEEDLVLVHKLIEQECIELNMASTCKSLYIRLIGYYNDEVCEIIIEDMHSNVTYIKKNNEVLLDKNDVYHNKLKDYESLNIKDIYDFCENATLDEELVFYLKRQLEFNYNIALEGLKNTYGANVGQVILKNSGNSVKEKAKAYTAAASDARMAGAKFPVVIISGSGNQGITSSVPLKVYADEYNISEEKLLRSLMLSDLIVLEEKKDIGRLSAFCGAISAGVAAVAGICYMLGGSLRDISHTIVNALAISSGVICDGAKSSCAAKIALSLESGFMGYEMFKEEKEFRNGEGIVLKGVDNTIRNVGRLASKGMRETDTEIIKMMLEN